MVIFKNDLINMPSHILRHLQHWSLVVVGIYIISVVIAIFLHCVFDMNIDMSFVPKLKIEPISTNQGAGHHVVMDLIPGDSKLWLMSMLLTYVCSNPLLTAENIWFKCGLYLRFIPPINLWKIWIDLRSFSKCFHVPFWRTLRSPRSNNLEIQNDENSK